MLADDRTRSEIVRILRGLPVLESERANIEQAAKDLCALAWVVSDETQPQRPGRRATEAELTTLARLCDELSAHIHSMHQASLEHIVWPDAPSDVREDWKGERLRLRPGHILKPAQEQWELTHPSPFELADQADKLKLTALDAFPMIWGDKAGGRPRKPGAFLTTKEAAATYERLTGLSATVVTDEEGKAKGPFLGFLAAIFKVLGIRASPEAQARALSRSRRKP